MCSFDNIDEPCNRADKSKWLSPIYMDTKTKYASPSHVNFHLDQRKVRFTFVVRHIYVLFYSMNTWLD
ncbi:hypothetical protein PR202_gb07616 [Eleusine coracana subsp. coracana]|uniref:Uncharacterized protein n=1 Tax=Eleusine coracana subsp. coracana TaxID=191504 RepID=A0AAV5ECJ5_ELECO|nr:hypothetical protein PR202_gb07616 [Eleusine coracana subsp. coracana]